MAILTASAALARGKKLIVGNNSVRRSTRCIPGGQAVFKFHDAAQTGYEKMRAAVQLAVAG